MGENANNDRMQQQSSDAQRQQVGQQNQQGDTRQPQQQQNNPQQAQPDQQNQQGERRPGERQEGRDIEGEGDGLASGVDTGGIQPGRTGQDHVER